MKHRGAPVSLYFIRHARNRLRQQLKRFRVDEVDVRTVLDAPQFDEPDERHAGRRNAWGKRGSLWIRVTYVREPQRTVVITLTVRRKGPGRG